MKFEVYQSGTAYICSFSFPTKPVSEFPPLYGGGILSSLSSRSTSPIFYWYLQSNLHGNFRYPPQSYPPSNKVLIAGLIKGNQCKPLIRPAISWGGPALGGPARIPMSIAWNLARLLSKGFWLKRHLNKQHTHVPCSPWQLPFKSNKITSTEKHNLSTSSSRLVGKLNSNCFF